MQAVASSLSSLQQWFQASSTCMQVSAAVLAGAGVAWWMYTLRPQKFATPTPSESAVVITGCSSGIGRHAALTLARKGFTVFAGVRKLADANDLVTETSSFTGRIVPTLIDVCDENSVQSSVKFVREELELSAQSGKALKLAALVSNAGVSSQNIPVEYMDLSKTKAMFDVNVWGGITFIQAFMPLVRENKGARIVVISSLMRCCTFQNTSSYGASKAALNTFMCCLRVELHPWRIPVLLIEPGAIRSALASKLVCGVEEVLDQKDTDREQQLRQRYGRQLLGTAKMMKTFDEYFASGPEKTSNAIAHAIEAPRPKLRYRVGADAWLMIPASTLLPDWICQIFWPVVTYTEADALRFYDARKKD